MKYYILQDKKAVVCPDLTKWAKQFSQADRAVQKTVFPNDTRVSTVFLGLDHRFGEGPPLLFETMVFGGPLDGEMDRYETWEDAVEGHKTMADRVIAEGPN